MPFLKNLFKKKTLNIHQRVAVPVLCYHSSHIWGTAYSQNNHTALEEDLRYLLHAQYRLLSPTALALALRQGNDALLAEKRVCITFDDGMDFDYFDQEHKDAGFVKSFHTILSESPLQKTVVGRTAPNDASSVAFMIVSAEARQAIDKTCLGANQFCDRWWRECAQQGIIGIGNHSWDHAAEALETVHQTDNIKGSFHAIDTYADADQQIRAAQDYLDTVTGGCATPLFAYPYGHAADYLVNEYFPNHEKEHRQLAAFGTGGEPVTRNSNLWALPRYVCGQHWRTPEEFEKMLTDLGSS
ncbi:MAG: polysaccharide deacetylase family protein [Proteobacteria bacterium]|nr:polysaccharide deacetylase family protein [Pseudomonadota bacterium]MCL2308276.1 polysaccharide deacetylase family protein [Pseudomonadota bacterium]